MQVVQCWCERKFQTGKKHGPHLLQCSRRLENQRDGLFDIVEMNMTQQYPVGGPREPVYALMRGLGFSMAKFSDKTWTSADKITVQIYGTGSMARITDEAHVGAVECELDGLVDRLDTLRRG